MQGGKVTLWEGGHRVPCFVRWPAGGIGLAPTPRENPVRRAYELRQYRDRPSIEGGQPSYDQVAALFAVRGAGPEFWETVSSPGGILTSFATSEVFLRCFLIPQAEGPSP